MSKNSVSSGLLMISFLVFVGTFATSRLLPPKGGPVKGTPVTAKKAHTGRLPMTEYSSDQITVAMLCDITYPLRPPLGAKSDKVNIRFGGVKPQKFVVNKQPDGTWDVVVKNVPCPTPDTIPDLVVEFVGVREQDRAEDTWLAVKQRSVKVEHDINRRRSVRHE